uniref:Gamma-butyrobetaine hydroxylase 1 n=1 Tax=Nothoprocta perdicaria TaxID=30464 RepID=A0A8C6Z9T4_NOTPE
MDGAAAMQEAEAVEGSRELRVRWADGSESRFPCVWLRDNCRCPRCLLPSAQARALPLEQLDVDLRVTWPDGHASEYEGAWLRARCFSEAARARVQSELFLPERRWWGSELELPRLPFDEVLRDAGSAYAWLRTLRETGVVLLRGAPARPGALLALGRRLGFLRLTFYGPTWLVQDKADANNVAYTSGRLPLHTDYPALQHPPGVQLLHCIEQAAAGGESELVDGLHVARRLRERSPDAFRLLAATAVDYADTGTDYCDFAVHCKQRIIDVDARGEPVRINYNNATRASVLDVAPEHVRPFYAALRAFDELLRHPEHVVTFKLEPGDVLTFDNWRLLHGRRGYEPGRAGGRCLEGAYADWDVVLSRLRLLRDEVRGGRAQGPAPAGQ